MDYENEVQESREQIAVCIPTEQMEFLEALMDASGLSLCRAVERCIVAAEDDYRRFCDAADAYEHYNHNHPHS